MDSETSVKSVLSEAPSIYAIQQGSAYLKVGDVGDSVFLHVEVCSNKKAILAI